MSILIKKVLLNNTPKDIYISDNIIEEISDNISVEADYKINGDGMAAIPSFINAHTHAAMTLFRGYADDMLLQDWLENKIWPLEAKLTEYDVYVGAKLACLEMIKTGTTFFNDMYWHFHGTAKAVEEMGIRAAISAVFVDIFDEKQSEEQIKRNEKLFKESKKYSDRIIFALGPHAIYTVSKESLQWAKEFSDKYDLLIHIHLSETEKEVQNCIKQNNCRPVEYLEKIGFLGENVILCHCAWLNNNEIEILSKYNVKINHNPTSNMKLAVGNVLPYKPLKEKGITISLGTDGCASNNNLDMLESMKFAALLQKMHTNTPTIMHAKEAYDLATLNGAKTFRLNTGIIKENKIADLLLIDLKRPEFTPNTNLISNLVYSANGSCIDTTICDGKILMQNRVVEGEEEIIEAAKKTLSNLMERVS